MTNPVTLWYNYTKEKYTPQLDKWPKVGCGARFVPWAYKWVMEVGRHSWQTGFQSSWMMT
eukprot:2057879-Prorocentrum_lima.AAC.1